MDLDQIGDAIGTLHGDTDVEDRGLGIQVSILGSGHIRRFDDHPGAWVEGRRRDERLADDPRVIGIDDDAIRRPHPQSQHIGALERDSERVVERGDVPRSSRDQILTQARLHHGAGQELRCHRGIAHGLLPGHCHCDHKTQESEDDQSDQSRDREPQDLAANDRTRIVGIRTRTVRRCTADQPTSHWGRRRGHGSLWRVGWTLSRSFPANEIVAGQESRGRSIRQRPRAGLPGTAASVEAVGVHARKIQRGPPEDVTPPPRPPEPTGHDPTVVQHPRAPELTGAGDTDRDQDSAVLRPAGHDPTTRARASAGTDDRVRASTRTAWRCGRRRCSEHEGHRGHSGDEAGDGQHVGVLLFDRDRRRVCEQPDLGPRTTPASKDHPHALGFTDSDRVRVRFRVAQRRDTTTTQPPPPRASPAPPAA